MQIIGYNPPDVTPQPYVGPYSPEWYDQQNADRGYTDWTKPIRKIFGKDTTAAPIVTNNAPSVYPVRQPQAVLNNNLLTLVVIILIAILLYLYLKQK